MPDIRMLLDVISGSLAVVVLVWGLYILLTGRFRFPGGISLEGRHARTAGIFLIASLLLAYLIPALLSRVDESRFLGSSVKLLTLLGGVSGAVIYAKVTPSDEITRTLTVLTIVVPAHATVLLILRHYIANSQPVPASAVLLLLAAGWFLAFRIIVAVAKLSRGKANLVGSVIAVLFVALHLWVVVGTPRVGMDPSIAQALAPVCSGQGIQEAAEYTGGPGPHTTVVLDSSGRLYESVRGLGPGWNPDSVADTELVLCVREETKESPLCPDGSRLDNVAGRYADLFEARTGRLVQRFDELTTPFKCPTEPEWTEDLTALSGLRSVLEDYLYMTEGD